MNEITEDDILKAIQEAVVTPEPGDLPRWEPGTVTTWMVKLKLGVSEYYANKVLDKLATEGRIRADKVVYYNPWGDKTRVNGYRLVQ